MNTTEPKRREFLSSASGGFGALALAGLISELQAADNPLAARNGHHFAKADRVTSTDKSSARSSRSDIQN